MNSDGTAIAGWSCKQSVIMDNGVSPRLYFKFNGSKIYIYLLIPTPSYSYYKGNLSISCDDGGYTWDYPMSWSTINTSSMTAFIESINFVRNGSNGNGGCSQIIVGSTGTDSNTLYFV
jgi:hypothetical protein